MNVAKIQKAIFWRELAVGTIVDLAICSLAWWQFGTEYSSAWEILGFFLGLQAILLLVMIRSFIVRTALNMATDAEFLENMYLASLRELKIPHPSDWHPRNYTMFDTMADDSDLDADSRVKAAYMGALFSAGKDKAGIARSVMMESAMDKAIIRYIQGLPANAS